MSTVHLKSLVLTLTAGLALGASAELRSLVPVPQSADPNSWWMRRHNEKMNVVTNGGAKVVFLGDSITHFWESAGRTPWQKYFAEGPAKALNLGFSADRTEHVLWRLQHGELDGYEAKAIVLMIGTNNSGHHTFAEEPPIDTIAGIEAVLKEIQARQPKARIILCSIFPRGEKPGDHMRVRNSIVNRELVRFCDGRRIIWCDFSDRFLTADGTLLKGIMPDRLHPAEYGYEIWAAAVLPYIRAALLDTDDGIALPQTFPSRVDPTIFTGSANSPTDGVTRWFGIGGSWRKRPAEQRRWIVDNTNGCFDAVFVGDSITHRWENEANGKKAYEELVLPNYSVLNLGIGGDTTETTLWRLENGQLEGYRTKLFMVMIGTNNRQGAKDVAEGIGKIVRRIRQKHPEAKVLLLPVFPCGAKPLTDTRRAEINRLAQKFADGKDVLWLDFNRDFLDAEGNMLPDVMMADNLHPIDKGYRIWWKAVRPVFREVIGK